MKPYTKKTLGRVSVSLSAIFAKIGEADYKLPPDPPKILSAIRPGDSINGGTGSICCFLINQKKDVFLLGDAHVIVKDPWAAPGQKDKVKAHTGEAIAEVVWHTRYTKEGPNRDIALARVEPEFCKLLTLGGIYKGHNSEKHFTVVKADSKPNEGMVVHLLGASTGHKVGKIKSENPGIVQAEFGEALVKYCDLVEVEPDAKDVGLAIGGDSGGLWVNDGGDAVGMQITGGSGHNSCFHPIGVIMEQVHKYDPSLRLLVASDIPNE
jgi:hypothetical protein